MPPIPQQQQRQQSAGHPPLPSGQAMAGAGSKGLAAGPVDFVLAVGDDRSDEDMFTAIEQYADTPRHPAEVFACVVGQRPSKAKFYVNDVNDVIEMLAKMGGAPVPPRVDSFSA
eukprot:GHUV01009976.1.p1 GENE.GHUV01009976.1~~GHUV01009976.1.p1  ORF type:complete len:129 (+),score=47.81 GHUV01009976.1:48-389(+)